MVRAAFGDSRAQCASPECNGSLEIEVIHVLVSLASLAQSYDRKHLDCTTPCVSWHEAKGAIGDDKLRELALEYLVRTEVWRLEDSRMTGCGPLNVPLQISVSFVQLWYMDREGCFYFRECLQPEQRWHG
ncbi:hypothetical protein HC256_008906 [Beauveria bassiana]|nr:hypothetical protein HC256_008906 [Beauveria bassiana]